MALECWALRSQRSSVSSARSCADTNRILLASCIDDLRRKSTPGAASGLRTTIASLSIAPFLVPPNETTSTPTSVVNSRKETPRDAAAFEMRAPSRCTGTPSWWAWSVIAAISSTE